MTACYSDQLWHVAYVEPRAEPAVAGEVGRLGLHVYVPMERIRARRNGYVVDRDRPLLPGYVFAAVDPYRQAWQSLLDCKGVIEVLMQNPDTPGRVPAAWVTSMQRAEQLGMFDYTTANGSQFQVSEVVRVSDGPFAGLNATIVDFIAKLRGTSATKRARVLIDFMGRLSATELPITSLEKL